MALDNAVQPANPLKENDSLSAKLAREGSLLASIPSQIGSGIKQRAEDVLQHKGLTALEIGASFALASGLTLMSKNPGTFGTVARLAPKVLLGLTALDVGRRFVAPMADTWDHPGNLARDKQWLGDNLGGALIDYPLVAIGGYAGDRITSGLFNHFSSTPLAARASQTDLAKPAVKDMLKATSKLAGRHALNGPLAFSMEALTQKIFPDHGLNPSFPRELPAANVSSYAELKPDTAASVISSQGVKLDDQNPTSSFGIKVDKAGPVRLDLNMNGPGTDWAVSGKESAVVSVYVDGKYSQDMVLFGGSKTEKYSFSLDNLAAGNHTVTLRYAKEKSTAGATGIDVQSGTADQYTYKNKIDQYVDQYAPVMYGRDGTNNNHTDVPMSLYHVNRTNGDGSVTITYGYFFSNEDGGTGTIPSVEQARWGRMTDVQDVFQVTVDPKTGKLENSQYMAEHDVWKPFNGSFDGTHPVIDVSTQNNDVSPQGSGPLLYRMEPDYQPPANAPLEDLQRQNPLWFRTSSVEIQREGKVDKDGVGDAPNDSLLASVTDWFKRYALGEGPPQMADPRNYLYVQQNLKNASASDPVAAEVVLNNGQTYVSDFGYKNVAIGRNGWSQTDVALPPDTKPADIAKVEFLSRGTGDAQVASVGHIFMLDQNYNPVEVNPQVDKNVIAQNAPSQGNFPNNQSNSENGK